MRYALVLLLLALVGVPTQAGEESTLPARKAFLVVECPTMAVAAKAAQDVHTVLRFPVKSLFAEGLGAITDAYKTHKCSRAAEELGIKVWGAMLMVSQEFRFEGVLTIRTGVAAVAVPTEVPGVLFSKSLFAVEIDDIALTGYFKALRRRMMPSVSL